MTEIGQTVFFEGIVSVRTAIHNMERRAEDGSYFNDRRIVKVFVDEKRAAREKKELAWLGHRAEELGFAVEITDGSFFDENTSGRNHGGIAAAVTERTLPEMRRADMPENGYAVMLEGIEDPFNLGFALRSLYAAGAERVILPRHNAMCSGGVVARSSAGASELMPICISDAATVAATAKECGVYVVCADERGEPVGDAELKFPLLLVIGGEKRGISSSVTESADALVRIVYGRGFGASLSAASAAAVLGFEMLKKRDAASAAGQNR
ncbi:MAG: RNA methyltransferase [Clostridia bacterium]|nr:RNA methyltransferase [Clostridia bacterium]